jgi:hypothetical protein
MPSLSLKCCCSATFDGSGENIWLEFRAKAWQEKHEKCPELYKPVKSNTNTIRLLGSKNKRNLSIRIE